MTARLSPAQSFCDADDGLTDRIISNVEACRAKQKRIIESPRCPAESVGDACLTEPQIYTARTISAGLTLPYSLAHGVRRQAGYNLFQGADFSRGAGMGHSPAPVIPPTVAANGYLYAQGDAYLRFMIARDPGFNSLSFSLNNSGAPEADNRRLRDYQRDESGHLCLPAPRWKTHYAAWAG